ncbi:hypothetical protein CRUP_003215 [Coryphaenoides rupestris]|nr:hypothetical protein CRUP_003215 [Coryphaenoides rupestris]
MVMVMEMEMLVALLVCVLKTMVHVSSAQPDLRAPVGPWRHKIEWENHGQVYSLLSTGTEYLSPRRRHTRLLLTSKGRSRPTVLARAPRRHQRGRVDTVEAGTTGDIGSVSRAHALRRAGATPPLSRNAIETHVSQPDAAPTDRGNVGTDEIDPHYNSRNSVYYNVHPPAGRSRPAARPRRPPGGTAAAGRGLPDLVPDPYYIQAASYIQRAQMYALRCAAEENCLSRSAYGASDLDYRVLLRFPQRVKNQGTTNFLPAKPRHQWEWHSCHQHYHSMDAFSNYDLLDVSTGRKVAEGHKASFCLEDTTCDPGVQRRFACTAHTQGLSPGCYDIYHANIDCQWIDITDVAPGNYILKVTVNPSQLIQESDFSNNVVRCDIRYTGTYVQARNCRISA